MYYEKKWSENYPALLFYINISTSQMLLDNITKLFGTVPLQVVTRTQNTDGPINLAAQNRVSKNERQTENQCVHEQLSLDKSGYLNPISSVSK